MRRTGFVYSKRYLEHKTSGNVESRARMGAVWDVLMRTKFRDQLQGMDPRVAPLDIISTCHTEEYIRELKEFSGQGGGFLDEDTAVGPASFEIARLAVGGALSAVDGVMEGQVDNAFAMVRPPGHHAEAHKAMGFCLFNNVAVAVRYARKRYGLNRIMIVDWDAHHGNGIQNAFYEDPSVLYFSIHQDGLYPLSGWANETGRGAGEGYNINIPVPKQTGDSGYFYIFTRILEPVVLQYKPELILVSAGFDAHFNDPLSSLEVTATGFGRMAEMLVDLAGEVCNGRLVAVLEGGYDLKTLGYSVLAVLNSFNGAGLEVADPIPAPPNVVRPQTRIRIDDALEIQKKYWHL